MIVRTCIVTKEKVSRDNFIRISKVRINDEHQIKVVKINESLGRSAYVKNDPAIINIAIQKGHIVRALKLGRNLTSQELEYLGNLYKLN